MIQDVNLFKNTLSTLIFFLIFDVSFEGFGVTNKIS